MEVRFLDHRIDIEPGAGHPRVDRWLDATHVPGDGDYVRLIGDTTWIVRYRVWREGGRLVDLFCSPWHFNL